MEIEESVIRREISIILHMIRKPNSIIVLLLTNDIGSFFVRKIDRIRFDIDIDQEVDAAHAFHSFQPLSENDVSALIRKSAKKSCPLDPMPTSQVVGCLDVLLPVIS